MKKMWVMPSEEGRMDEGGKRYPSFFTWERIFPHHFDAEYLKRDSFFKPEISFPVLDS